MASETTRRQNIYLSHAPLPKLMAWVRLLFCVLILQGVLQGALPSHADEPLVADNKIPDELKGVGITEHLAETIKFEGLNFKDESGKPVALSSYFHQQRPVLLNLVYYECANLCNFVLNGMVDAMKPLDWTPGNQYDVVTVSIDPKEGADLAMRKKTAYLTSLGKPQAASGWHFLTGQEPQIKSLAAQVGFGFRYNEAEKQFAHSAAIFVLTPEGKISRYLYGISFTDKDLKLALLEASNGKVGTISDRLLLFCYRYNAATGRYSFYVTKLMSLGGLVTTLLLGGYLATFWIRQRRLSLNAGGLAVAEHKGG